MLAPTLMLLLFMLLLLPVVLLSVAADVVIVPACQQNWEMEDSNWRSKAAGNIREGEGRKGKYVNWLRTMTISRTSRLVLLVLFCCCCHSFCRAAVAVIAVAVVVIADAASNGTVVVADAASPDVAANVVAVAAGVDVLLLSR